MSYYYTRAALANGFEEFKAASYPSAPVTGASNSVFEPPANTPIWFAVALLPSGSEALTFGDDGMDRDIGIFQIDINVPLNSGEKAQLLCGEQLKAHFVKGRGFTFGDTILRITNLTLSSPRRTAQWYTRSVSVFYECDTPRNVVPTDIEDDFVLWGDEEIVESGP